MTEISAIALACTQCIEAMARLMLSLTRMGDCEQVEVITTALNNMAYEAEHAATYHEDED